MVTEPDKILKKMNRNQLIEIIKGYEKLNSNLNYEVLCLKYALFLESPSLAIKIPISIEDESDDIPDVPSIVDLNFKQRKDVMYL